MGQLIRRKAAKLKGMSCFGPCMGEDDLRQELALRWCEKESRHDSARASLPTFADRVLNSRCADLLRKAQAQKRDRRRERPVHGDASTNPQAIEALDLHLDVRDALAAMPAESRLVVTLLMQMKEASVVRATGVGRQRVRTIRGGIKHHLQKRGLS